MSDEKKKGRKHEPPLYIDMDFGEAAERFSGVDPREVEANIAKSKMKKPPGRKGSPSGPRRRKPASHDAGDVVRLKDRRKPPAGG